MKPFASFDLYSEAAESSPPWYCLHAGIWPSNKVFILLIFLLSPEIYNFYILVPCRIRIRIHSPKLPRYSSCSCCLASPCVCLAFLSASAIACICTTTSTATSTATSANNATSNLCDSTNPCDNLHLRLYPHPRHNLMRKPS